MISLIELFHSSKKENADGLVEIDSWRFPDVEHLVDMGFAFKDDYRLHIPTEPEITIYKKKEEVDGKKQDFFHLEEKDREPKRFKTFDDVLDYFDSYEQPDLDRNM